MKTLKYSRQREAIKSFLCSTNTHPTAEDVYIEIKKQYPRISLGTVYRNLSLLVGLGEAKRLTDTYGIEHYDAIVTPHVHFICTECSHVIDLPLSIDKDLDQLASASFNGTISGHNVYFYGLCPSCMAKKNS